MENIRELFVTSALSLSMIDPPCTLKVREISDEEYVELVRVLENDGVTVTVRIGHQSTVEALRSIFKGKLNFPDADRTPVKLYPGSALVVIQLLKRPQEGQIYSSQEIEDIMANKLYKILFVTVE